MKRQLKAVAVALAVATAAAMLARSTGGDRKAVGADIFGHKVLEMLFCFPITDGDAKQSTAFSGAGAAAPATSCGQEAT